MTVVYGKGRNENASSNVKHLVEINNSVQQQQQGVQTVSEMVLQIERNTLGVKKA